MSESATLPLMLLAEDIPAGIFRAYDIRGEVAPDGLSEAVVHDIAVALGSEVQSHGLTEIVVGRDGRLSSPSLQRALIDGLKASGCHVINIGLVPTPVLYFAVHHLGTKSGVMLTGSHNPVNYNGLKMIVNGKTLTSTRVKGLYDRLQSRDVVSGTGSEREENVKSAYIKKITSTVPLSKKLKVIVDAGNGAASELAPKLFEAMGCEVMPLYCEVDGSFPNHHPDPSKPENLNDIIAAIKENHADLGLAFDGDADRVGVVTNAGEIIYPDRLIMLYAKAILKEHPNQEIVFDVKCSKNLAGVIEKAGGKPLMFKTGHSILKNKMLEDGAIMAGEMSGHVFFNDERWYGFDDGLYCGARLLEIIANDGRDAASIFAQIPNSVSTPEIQVAIPDTEKFDYVNQLVEAADFPEATLITIDGLRVEFDDAWALIRASNTTPCLTLRFEADSEAALKAIQEKIKAFMLVHRADLKFPF